MRLRAREVKSPVVALCRPQGLADEEIQLLRAAAAPAELNFSAIRNRFLLELLLSTGLRADEVRLLVIGQLSEDRSWLRNVKTKGKNGERNVSATWNQRQEW